MAVENQAHARTGLHCKVSVIGPDGPVDVGSFEDASYKIEETTEEYKEIGEPFASRITTGFTASGSVNKGYIRNTLARTAIPNRIMRGETPGEGPSFILAFSIKRADESVDLATFHGCKIPSLDISMAKGKVSTKHNWYCTEGYELATI
ncbi:MAG: hypothetical protein GF399_10405 [Candidatus Coatesbacteria bacterium]|nr:hypothetical protein [Candidatus Coatesbacteria bacterium]